MTAENYTPSYPRPTPPTPGLAEPHFGQDPASQVKKALDGLEASTAEAVADLKNTTSAAAMEAKAQATDLAWEASEAIGATVEAGKEAAAEGIATIADSVEWVASRRPYTFLAVGFAAGLILGRLMLNSSRSA
jgi:ElaB/YqjD/DUF883 family membrane-anchored ribosome-binding protein